MLVYVGSYAPAEKEGIYLCRLDVETGKLSRLSGHVAGENPSFLAIHPNKQFLYAVNEAAQMEGKSSGAVSAFAIDPVTGDLKLLNRQLSNGAAPCHLVVDATGKCVLVANYTGGNFAVLPLNDDGSLQEVSCTVQHHGSSVNRARQEAPHGHSINLDASNSLAFAADLGVDRLFLYELSDDKRSLTAHGEQPYVSLKPGAGPRHFSFHPSGKFAYVINELDSTIAVFAYEKGKLTAAQTVPTLPEDFTGSSTTAEIRVHPNGKFVYGSNRGHDSIAVFAVDPGTGTLISKGHVSTRGKTPRNFEIDPSGRFLLAANQDSDSVVVFTIDSETGGLTPTGHEIALSRPVCVRFFVADSK